MSSQPQKRVCHECGSRRFKKDAATGRIVCQSGHVLQGYVRETQEQDEAPSQHFNVTRKLRKNKKKKVKTPSQRYHGDRARFLQYEAGQILLRQQIAALIELWELPAELEVIARDLWALYISSSDLPPAPLQHSEALPDPPDPESLPPPLTESESDYTSDEENLEAYMEKVKLDDQVTRPPEKPKLLRAHDLKRTFHLSFTLVICYLSCATLRIPVFWADLIRLVELGELPFLNFADRLPKSMKSFTYSSTFLSLNLGHPPSIYTPSGTGQSLVSWTHRFVGLYNSMDVTFPDLNVGPLLWRACKAFCLPPTFYQAARKLLSRLDADFSFKLKGDPYNHLRAAAPYHPTTNKKITTDIPYSYMVPDAVIVCSVILCAKAVWGLDDEQRYPLKDDPLWTLPTQSDWLTTVQQVNKHCSNEPLNRLFEKPTADYSEEEIDVYLDYAEDFLENPRERPQFFDRIEEAFPLPPKSGLYLGSHDAEPDIKNLYSSVNETTHAQADMDDEFLLSGEEIKQYAKNDHAVLPRAMEEVLAIASDVVGIESESLLKCLWVMEERLSEIGIPEGWESAWQDDDTPLADLSARTEQVNSGLYGDVEMEG